ncbi:hypothetical protein BD779DRAFT_1682365 [Infundibulicybe gibba]|nr:hypothetical protein BD779DRAFT_1682365 [Infundibulicybe gibba]
MLSQGFLYLNVCFSKTDPIVVVKSEATESVDALKEAIQAKRSPCSITSKGIRYSFGKYQSPVVRASRSLMGNDHVHIVVKPPSHFLSLNRCFLENSPNHPAIVVKIKATESVYALTTGIQAQLKSDFAISVHELQLWMMPQPSPDQLWTTPPSLADGTRKGLRGQGKRSAVYAEKIRQLCVSLEEGCFACARPPEQEPSLPLALTDPIFAKFIADCETIKLTEAGYHCAEKLRKKMEFHETEADRGREFRVVLGIAGIEFDVESIEKEHTTDGHISRGGRLVVVVEVRNEIGWPGAEPSLQALLYYDDFAQKNLLAKDSNVGPHLAFGGCALTDRSTMETFSAIPLDFQTNASAYLNLARHLTALEIALDGLGHRYSEAALETRPVLPLRTLSSASFQNSPAPACLIFPYPTTFIVLGHGNRLSFEYIAGFEHWDLLFTRVTERNERIGIKFCDDDTDRQIAQLRACVDELLQENARLGGIPPPAMNIYDFLCVPWIAFATTLSTLDL